MRNRGVLVLLVVAAVAGVAGWWIKGRDQGGTPATRAVTQRAGSASTTTTTKAHADQPKPARMTITIHGGEQVPLAGASVRVAPEEGEPTVVISDAQGVALVENLEPGVYRISASAKGFLPRALPESTLAAGDDRTLTLSLEPGGRPLRGTVTDASGGTVADARVSAVQMASSGRPGRAVATTVTGADGTYQLSVAEGHLTVSVTSADYAPQARSVEVGAEGATADFALVPGGVIEGVVRDARSKAPVAGAIVEAERDGGSGMRFSEGSSRRVTAGPDGRFRLGGLRPGAYEVGASSETLRTLDATVVGLGVAEQVTDVQLLVGGSATISGTAVDEANTPIPGIDVAAFGARLEGGSAKTDAKGSFVMSGLSPGAYTFMVRSEKYAPVLGAPIELADKDVTGVIVRAKRGLEIVGRIEPPQPCEVEHARDENDPAGPFFFPLTPSSTGNDGVFELSPATPGKARLSAVCASGDRGEIVVEVKAGMPEVVLAVKPGASISGKVVDGTGKPVAGMTVMASAESGTIRTTIVNGMVTSGVQALTNAQGLYKIVGVPEGSHRVSVLDRGRPARMRGKPVVVKLGATEKKTGVDLAVELPNGVIEGVVTGPDGKPLADAWVSVHQDIDSLFAGMVDGADEDEKDGEPRGRSVMRVETRDDSGEGGGSELAPVLTDAQGRFAVRSLPRATYEVIAEAQAGALRGRAVNVEPDAKLTIQALGVTSLSGTVRTAKGPVALFALELEGPTSAARTFTGGTFKLGRVDPGNYTVTVKSAEGHGEAKVTVLANQPATVEVVLAANAVVVGKLVDPHGTPMPDVGVLLVPDSGDGRTRIAVEGMPPMSGADGSFRASATAGTMALVVLTQPRPVIKKGLVLEAGKTLDAGTITVDPTKPPKP